MNDQRQYRWIGTRPNRPDGAEIDNTDRTFVVERGRFEDSDVDQELGPFRTEDEA